MNTETSTPKGFKEVPGNEYFLVNEDGQVWSKKLGRLVKISKQKTGYRTVAQATPDGVKTFYVHRLVATAFIEIPQHVKDYPGRAEVNHKDGDKGNNRKSNLEWVTPKRNVRHSIDTGLTIHRAVEAKHVHTGHLLRFPTATDCAKHFNISWRRLVRHLNSNKAGLLTKNWYVFRYEDNCDWPHIPDDRKMENRWDQPYGMYFVREDGSGVTAYCETMTKLAEMTGIPFSSIQSVVRTDGRQYRLNNHTFWYDEYPVETIMSGSKYRKKHEFSEVRNVKVYDFKTDKTTIYESVRKAAKALGISPTRLHYYIKNKKPHDGKAYWLV